VDRIVVGAHRRPTERSLWATIRRFCLSRPHHEERYGSIPVPYELVKAVCVPDMQVTGSTRRRLEARLTRREDYTGEVLT